ncbi:hypothetical protein [Pseudomonas rhizoryzae]|nr:hypothetical protein [Pseudomonas rhizoryzae]KTT31047.1 hypothetical protein SB9_18910 [Pseudomonas psychrotolerans]
MSLVFLVEMGKGVPGYWVKPEALMIDLLKRNVISKWIFLAVAGVRLAPLARSYGGEYVFFGYEFSAK